MKRVKKIVWWIVSGALFGFVYFFLMDWISALRNPTVTVDFGKTILLSLKMGMPVGIIALSVSRFLMYGSARNWRFKRNCH